MRLTSRLRLLSSVTGCRSESRFQPAWHAMPVTGVRLGLGNKFKSQLVCVVRDALVHPIPPGFRTLPIFHQQDGRLPFSNGLVESAIQTHR